MLNTFKSKTDLLLSIDDTGAISCLWGKNPDKEVVVVAQPILHRAYDANQDSCIGPCTYNMGSLTVTIKHKWREEKVFSGRVLSLSTISFRPVIEPKRKTICPVCHKPLFFGFCLLNFTVSWVSCCITCNLGFSESVWMEDLIKYNLPVSCGDGVEYIWFLKQICNNQSFVLKYMKEAKAFHRRLPEIVAAKLMGVKAPITYF